MRIAPDRQWMLFSHLGRGTRHRPSRTHPGPDPSSERCRPGHLPITHPRPARRGPTQVTHLHPSRNTVQHGQNMHHIPPGPLGTGPHATAHGPREGEVEELQIGRCVNGILTTFGLNQISVLEQGIHTLLDHHLVRRDHQVALTARPQGSREEHTTLTQRGRASEPHTSLWKRAAGEAHITARASQRQRVGPGRRTHHVPPSCFSLRLLRRLGAPPSDGSKSDPVIGSPGIGPHRGGERRWIPRLPESSPPTGPLLRRLPHEPPPRLGDSEGASQPPYRLLDHGTRQSSPSYPTTISPPKSQRWMPHTPTIQQQVMHVPVGRLSRESCKGMISTCDHPTTPFGLRITANPSPRNGHSAAQPFAPSRSAGENWVRIPWAACTPPH